MIVVNSPADLASQLNKIHPKGWWFGGLTDRGMRLVDGAGMPLGDEIQISYQSVPECDLEDCTLERVNMRQDRYLFAIWHSGRFIGLLSYEGYESQGFGKMGSRVWRRSTPGTKFNATCEQIDSVCWDGE